VVEVAETVAAAAREAARLASEGRHAEAVAAYQRLLERSPGEPDCWYNLGLLQRRLGEFEAALGSYAQALRHGIRQPEQAHLNRAAIFSDGLHRQSEAQRELEAALALNPEYLPALQNLANLHETLGRGAEARDLYERILLRWPQAFEALSRYALLSAAGGAADERLVARLRDALGHPAAGTAERASLGFALARLLDQAGDYPAAFAAATAANRASRRSAGAGAAPYDRLAHERFIDALITAFPERATQPPEAVPGEAPEGAAAASQAPATPRPIFICGMFRSGSTLTERMLAGHPWVTPGGELDILPRLVRSSLWPFPGSIAHTDGATLAGVAAEYVRQLARLFPGAGCVTDKRPDNFLLIGLIKRLFPGAKVVHTTRDALDTCLSIFFLHLDPRVSWALDLADIGHYFRQYRRLMTHWRSVYGEEILDFDYDALVREPRPLAQRLLGFCDLEWDERCLDFAAGRGSVASASVWQVREPLYQRSSGRARHYARELSALATYLAAGE
jgi:Tfp pilus assembly protein PilF